MTNHPNRSKKSNPPSRWVEVCRVLRLMGLMEDFSKAECLRIADLLQARIDAGKVERLSRGLYQIVEPAA
jgi:hypothetical protein